ncbi:MAG: hypothetical protein DCO99_03565 [Synechococcus sp. XM-24]|nr:MAG: hypothetical protein DCO99_03565 [Synechococcus sp. XM-24]
MAPRTKADPTERVAVTFIDSKGERHDKVRLPRHLLEPNVSLKARERFLVSDGQLPDPSAPPLPATVEEVVDAVKVDQVAATQAAVDQLQAQLAEIQSNLQGTPLSHAELVAAREEITGFLLKAADAAAQLVVVEGAGSRIRAELQAIADPLVDQAAETARQQAENAEVQQRVLDDLQAQSAALFEALAAEAAGALVEINDTALAKATETARKAAQVTAKDIASSFRPSSVTIAAEDPRKTDPESWALRHYGFEGGPVAGDGVFLTGTNGVTALLYKGRDLGWVQSAELLPKVVTATGPVIADRSTHIGGASFVTNIRSGGGGSAGVLPLLTREVRIGVSTYVPICRHYDWDIPSKYWGGDPTASGYEDDDVSWERKPYETQSFLVRINAQDTGQIGSYGAASFMVMRHADGRLDVQIHELNTEGRFTADWVDEFKIVELRQDFTVESGNRVGAVTGLELQLRFQNEGKPPAFDAVLRGSIFPMIQRRAGI